MGMPIGGAMREQYSEAKKSATQASTNERMRIYGRLCERMKNAVATVFEMSEQ